MDRESAKRLAKAVVANITQELLGRRITPLTATEVNDILNKTLENVFSTFEEDDKKLVYNELSIQFHADKFKLTHPQLFAFLDALSLSDLPQKILNFIKAQPKQYFQLMRFKEQYKREQALLQTTGNFFKSILSKPKDALTMLQKRWYNNPIVRDFERYVQPFYFLACAIFLSSIAILGLATVARHIVSVILSTTIAIANSVMRKISEPLTNGLYGKLVDEYLQANLDTLKDRYIIALRKTTIEAIIDSNEGDEQERFEQAFTLAQASNDEFLKLHVQQQVRVLVDFGLVIDELEPLLLDNHLKKISGAITGVERLKFTVIAFYQTLTRPLDEPKLISIALRSLQAIAACIVVPVITLAEVADYLRKGLNYAASALIVSTHYALLLALDLPLKIYDLLGEAYKWFQSKNQPVNSPANEVLSPNYCQALVVFSNHESKATPAAKREFPPLHFGSPIAAPRMQATTSSTEAIRIGLVG